MRPRSEQPVVALILRDLKDGPATVDDLEQVIGIHRRNLRAYLKLMNEQLLVHIGGWEQRTGPALPVWHFGTGKNKKRPARLYTRRGNSERIL